MGIGQSIEDRFAREIGLFEVYLSQGKTDKALLLADDLFKKVPESCEFCLLRPIAKLSSGDAEGSLVEYNRCIDLFPNHYLPYAERSYVYQVMMIHERAIADLDSAIRRAEPFTETYYGLIFQRGINHHNAQNFEASLNDSKIYFEYDSTNLQAIRNLGMGYSAIGNHAKAIYYLEKLRKLAPNEIESYVTLSFAYIRNNEPEKTIALLDDLSKLREDADKYAEWGLAYSNMGEALRILKDYKASLMFLQKSIQIYPGNSYVYRNRALTYLALKQPDKACKDLRKSLELGFSRLYGSEVQNLLSIHCQ